VVSGIGFIGAGIIIFQKNRVSGLTTAAGLWVTASIGLGAGCGLFAITAVCTVLVLFCLEIMHFYTIRLGDKNVVVVLSSKDMESLREALKVIGKEVERYTLSKSEGRIRAEVTLRVPVKEYTESLIERLSALPNVELDSLE